MTGAMMMISKAFDYNRIRSNVNNALKRIRPKKVAVGDTSFLKYEDVGYASAWRVEDKLNLEQLYFRKIRRNNQLFTEIKQQNRRIIVNNPINYPANPDYLHTLHKMNQLRIEKHRTIASFEDRVKRAWDDRTIPDDIIPAESGVTVNEIQIKPTSVDTKEDMMVNDGMERFALLICDESNTYFRHYAIGASTIPSGIGQVKLFDERARAPIDEFGWFSAIGTLIRGGAMFPQTIGSFSIAESAACDQAVGGIIAWRTAYTSPVPHTLNTTFPVASHVVYQIPAGANSS
jgi:hypothetical protein